MFKGLGGLGDMAGMMKKAQEMQKQMGQLQEDLHDILVIGESGAGLVTNMPCALADTSTSVATCPSVDAISAKGTLQPEITAKRFAKLPPEPKPQKAPVNKGSSAGEPANSPEQELASFILADGFVAELVASEAQGANDSWAMTPAMTARMGRTIGHCWIRKPSSPEGRFKVQATTTTAKAMIEPTERSMPAVMITMVIPSPAVP